MKHSHLRGMSLAAAVIAILTCAAHAAENPVHWSTEAVPQKPLHPGANFSVKLVGRIDPGWHLYGLEQQEGGPIPTEMSLPGQSFLTLGEVRASKPIQFLDPNFNQRVSLYVEKAEFRLPLTVLPTAPSSSQHAAIQVRYQCCDQTMCLPPRTVTIDLPLSIKSK